MTTIERLAPVPINKIHGPDAMLLALPVASTSQEKLAEYDRAQIKTLLVNLTVPEIQNKNPRIVVAEKAIDAWRKHGGAVVVDDTSFEVDAQGGRPGPYVKDFLDERAERANLCRTLTRVHEGESRGATFRVLLAMYDGREVHIREGVTRGHIPDTPRGTAIFGFDDIFVPDHTLPSGEKETRTYAEMSPEEKDETSARMRAIRSLKENPFKLERLIYSLQEPQKAQVESMRLEELLQVPGALQFAYDTEATRHMVPDTGFGVSDFLPYHRIDYGGVIEYKVDKDSASQGLVINPSLDLKVDADGNPARLKRDIAGDPILLQMGPEQVKMALASRALEFAEMHSEGMHEHIRAIRDGKVRHVKRSNTRSQVLEKMIGWKEDENGKERATKVIATEDIAYDRISSSKKKRSRKEAARNGLFINTKFGPMSMLALGDMPPTGGSKDMLVLGAMGYSQCWIPRNGVFAGNFERQMKLFNESKAQIESYGLPKDIEELCVSKIGLQVGSENPKEIARQVAEFQAAGGKSVRIATTNPDKRILQTAKEIRKAVGEDFMIAAGTITDAKQARKLASKKYGSVDMFFIGHGAGENCTSLEGGGAANSISILYDLYKDPKMNDKLLFMEGGIGQNYGPLLGMVDGFSINKKAVGGIESTAGLYAEHYKNAKPVIPYHGSASPGTQLIEAYMNPEIAKKRLNAAGKLNANEGKPNYYSKPDWVASSADRIRMQRELIGRALADQAASSIHELRDNVRKNGRQNIVKATAGARQSAVSHRA